MRERKRHSSPSRASGTPRSTVQRSATDKGTISIHFVRPVADALEAQGIGVAPVLQAAGIPMALLAEDRSRVSAAQYAALWRATIPRLDDEFFGLDSRRMKDGSFALLTRAVVHCPTLGSALERAIRFFGICLDDLSIELERSGPYADLRLRPREPGAPVKRFAHETLLVMLHGLACWLVGRRIPVLQASFAYPAPAHADEYLAIFSPSLQFDAPCTGLAFEVELLELPVVQSERSAKEFLRLAPANILLKYKSTHSLSSRIRRRLRQLLPHELPDQDALAREFAIAPATLRRRLKAEGETYQTIKDQLRRDLAIAYLSSTDLSIRDIALALGFEETSTFHRAFRKWSNLSPGAYRRAEQPLS
jgi:AraC-like DNA-binding protein